MISRDFLAALLYSEFLSWTLKRRSRAWRGGNGSVPGQATSSACRSASHPSPSSAKSEGLHAACCTLAAQLCAGTTDRDKDLLGRLYDDVVATFDRRIFELYAVTSAERLIVQSV